jgi:hypothetical protein
MANAQYEEIERYRMPGRTFSFGPELLLQISVFSLLRPAIAFAFPR